jgi:hypothetical protein
MALSSLASSRRSARGRRGTFTGFIIILVTVIFWHISGLPMPQKRSTGLYTGLYNAATNSKSYHNASNPTVISTSTSPAVHPIDTLIERAGKDFESLLEKETHDLPSAAAVYRAARGRHPPPRFDLWYAFAKEHRAVMVEEFWDQIYHDLSPFWALPPSHIRLRARAHDMVVKIVSGRAESNTGWFWHVIWAHLLDMVSDYLPDMVVPLNSMDEPRIMVPWDKIGTYVKTERASRKLTAVGETMARFDGWGKEDVEENVAVAETEWLLATPFSLAYFACPPESAIRKVESAYFVPDVLQNVTDDGYKLVRAHNDRSWSHLHAGFVANYTLSADICHQPELGQLHGALFGPLTARSSQELIPLFGGSKLTINNDILLPAPVYWNNEERFSVGAEAAISWRDKNASAMWRGTATGGHNTPTNWHHFHRHRFVAMTNGTKYRIANKTTTHIFTPSLKLNVIEALQAPIRKDFDAFLMQTTDIAFTDLMCDVPQADRTCFYTSSEFRVVEEVPLQRQFGYKYLPDIDGNSFSGRYRAFLLSQSLPIKATLYREWHDSRLVAWKHFVPMDNRFSDFYGIMEYFSGFNGADREPAGAKETVKGHDAAAETIATEGREWANKVLRKEDMAIYVLRLLLEYARLTDDKRDRLGYVDDLKSQHAER